MSSRGKTGKGLGKGGAKRHRKVLRDNIQGITKHDIRRLMRRGGVKRISGLMYEEVRTIIKIYLENVLSDAITFTTSSRRKTVTAADIEYSLWTNGYRTVYGGLTKSSKSSGTKTRKSSQRKSVPARTSSKSRASGGGSQSRSSPKSKKKGRAPKNVA